MLDEHIYADDRISGAEFRDRPGLFKLLANLKDLDAVVMSEISRLGRDMWKNAKVLESIINGSRVRVFYYLSDKEELLDTPEQRLMVQLSSFASEMERVKTGERTRDALRRKAAAGYSAGGQCFGYESVPVMGTAVNGEAVRLHVDYRIKEDEAEIVRAIFGMYADGHGLTAIAKALNGDPRYADKNLKYFAGRTPRAPQNGTGSWCPTCIRAMLYRSRYAGVLEYGHMRSVRDVERASRRIKNPNTREIIRVERSDLRIIDAELWDKVQARLKAIRETYIRSNNGQLWGRPETGRESRYLLSGLAVCALCGSNITVVGGQKRSHYYYGCSYYQNRGCKVCANDTRARRDDVDAAVICAIERVALTPEAIEAAVDRAIEMVESKLKETPSQVPKLEAELARVRRELDNFLALVAAGAAPASVVAEILKREEKIKSLEAELLRYHVPVQISPEVLRRYMNRVTQDLGRFKDLLYGDVAKARQLLRKLLRDANGRFAPLRFTPVERDGVKGFDFEGQILAGVVFNNVGAEERT